jgi:hypothetical protein
MRLDPSRMMLGMMPRACGECAHIQHVFFKTQDEFDTWDCPVCEGRLQDGNNPEPEIKP